MTEENSYCTLEIGSVTQSMKVLDMLAAAAIPARLVKAESPSRHGCVWGISYSCAQENNVRAVLANARQPVRHRRR